MRFCCLVLCITPLVATELQVDLRNPIYRNGHLTTHDGGVIQNDEIRIQAQNIDYVKTGAETSVSASGDLMIQYKGRAYVGTELFYNFASKEGVICNGKTFASHWYIGGERICLRADGSYKVENATITTCENAKSTWDLSAGSLRVLKSDLLEAEKVRFRLFHIPAFWFPSFKVNLNKFQEPLLRYSINWDKGQGPRAMVRYQIYSWRDFAMYGRIDYRLSTGWGGAFETEYCPSEWNTRFITRSYLATDRLETAPDKMFRYRLQGLFDGASDNGKTTVNVSWDKYSDVRMPSDFASDDFEVNTAKKTIFYLRTEEDRLISSLKVRPRFNAFESIKQDLPSLYASFRPFSIGKSGIYSTSVMKASYMNFQYSTQLVETLANYSAPRLEFRQKFHRPFHMGPLSFTPEIGGIGIFYGTSQSSEPKTLVTLSYAARADARASRIYSRYKHQIEPYLEFTGLSIPTVGPDSHYIFTIQDGYHQINQLQGGVRNLLFSQQRKGKGPSFSADLYANAFFADFTIPRFIPRAYLDLGWNLSSLNLSIRSCWNFWNQVLDYTNAKLQWTINENCAFSLEGRYRSQYDWRKADHESFVLDVTRTESELLLSPLSDQRATILTHFFFRPTPFWECHIQSHHGFYRSHEKPYNEVKVDLYTWINSALKLRISYSHLDLDDRVTAGISLIKK